MEVLTEYENMCQCDVASYLCCSLLMEQRAGGAGSWWQLVAVDVGKRWLKLAAEGIEVVGDSDVEVQLNRRVQLFVVSHMTRGKPAPHGAPR